jgi:molybdopterin molybdotransferase
MISVADAKKIILENCNPSKIEESALLEAVGSIVAEPVLSPIDTPPFDQSAMDGYAFSYETWNKKSPLSVRGEVQAGTIYSNALNHAEAVRIFTGAALPLATDTVVMQEKVTVNASSIIINDEKLVKGSNVRLQASQIKTGDLALPVGHQLSPASISFLAGMGIEKVKVFAKPRVSIIVTGKELVKPGQPVPKGKIYESNSYGLVAALHQLGIHPLSVRVADDDVQDIVNTYIEQPDSDICILTGGVSVGEYDFVARALEKCGVERIFHRVKQKPGKPFYFGKHDDRLVFALPGNPAAVLTCFYEYVLMTISHLTKVNYYRKIQVPIVHDFQCRSGLTYFLKGKTKGAGVEILDRQESYLMNSFSIADCLVELQDGKTDYKKGDMVSVSMIM